MYDFRAVVHGIAHIGNLNGLTAKILFVNSGAIFTTHLESQLRRIPPKRTPYPRLLGYGARRTPTGNVRSEIWRSEPMERSNAQTYLLYE